MPSYSYAESLGEVDTFFSMLFLHVWSSLATKVTVGQGYGNACERKDHHCVTTADRYRRRQELSPLSHRIWQTKSFLWLLALRVVIFLVQIAILACSEFY